MYFTTHYKITLIFISIDISNRLARQLTFLMNDEAGYFSCACATLLERQFPT